MLVHFLSLRTKRSFIEAEPSEGGVSDHNPRGGSYARRVDIHASTHSHHMARGSRTDLGE